MRRTDGRGRLEIDLTCSCAEVRGDDNNAVLQVCLVDCACQRLEEKKKQQDGWMDRLGDEGKERKKLAVGGWVDNKNTLLTTTIYYPSSL